jgi:hypothetical protein
MTDLKFFHKLMIVVVVIALFSKLATVKLSQLIPRRKPQPQVITKYIEVPVQREPERIVVKEYVQVPAPAPAPTVASYAAPRYRPVASPRAAVVMEDAPTPSSGGVTIPDDTFRRFFG